MDAEFDYLHFGPAASSKTAAPLVVFLHGAGERGNIVKLRNASLPGLLAGGLSIDAHIVCPHLTSGPGWPIRELDLFIRAMIEEYAADPARLYLTGESMGGRGVFEYAYWHADRLAAILPVCAFGIPNLAPRLSDLPVWMFHGEADAILPLARSREMMDALDAAGAPADLTTLEGRGHGIAREVYGRADVWSWLLSNRTSERSAEAAKFSNEPGDD